MTGPAAHSRQRQRTGSSANPSHMQRSSSKEFQQKVSSASVAARCFRCVVPRSLRPVLSKESILHRFAIVRCSSTAAVDRFTPQAEDIRAQKESWRNGAAEATWQQLQPLRRHLIKIPRRARHLVSLARTRMLKKQFQRQARDHRAVASPDASVLDRRARPERRLRRRRPGGPGAVPAPALGRQHAARSETRRGEHPNTGTSLGCLRACHSFPCPRRYAVRRFVAARSSTWLVEHAPNNGSAHHTCFTRTHSSTPQ
jgi:hypothetical protein